MKIFKWVSGILTALIIVLLLMIIYSPYGKKAGFDEKIIIEKISIKAPAAQVYTYLGTKKHKSIE